MGCRLAPALVLALAAACRGNDATLDAPPADGSAGDASGPHVVVRTGVAGAHVYFLGPDGALVLATTTANDGTAGTVLAAGGSVTVVPPIAVAGGTQQIFTFTGVAPSDELTVELGSLGGLGSQPVPIQIAVTYPLDAAAASYQLRTSCGQVALPATGAGIAALAGCGSAIDLALVSSTGSGVPSGVIALAAQPITAGGTLAITGAYAALGSSSITLTDVPAAASALAVSKQVFDAASSLGNSGCLFEADEQLAGSGSSVGFPDLPVAVLPGLAQIVTTTVTAAHAIVAWGSDSTAYTLDVGASVLADYATPPAFSGRTLGWTSSATGVAPDVAIAEIDSAEVTESSPTLAWQWLLAGSASTDALVFPLPPSDVFDFADTALGSAFVGQLTTYAVPGGYDTVRPNAFAFAPAQLAVAGTTGQVAVTLLDTSGN